MTMYHDEAEIDACPADLAFEELPIEARVMLLDNVLVDLKPKRRTYLLKNPGLLGVEAEASLIGLQCAEDLHRYLRPSDLERLESLVNEALMARLPTLSDEQVTL